MIRVTSSTSRLKTQATTAADHYSLAGHPVVFDSAVAALQAFHVGPASEAYSDMLYKASPPSLLNSENADLAYHGPAPFDGQVRNVRFWRRHRFAQIDVDGTAVCSLDFDERHIYLLVDVPFDDPLALQVITGPALVLLLAELETYCLHAAAVRTEIGNIGIIAESGAGKSTLSNHVGPQWQQLADDILPLTIATSASLTSVSLSNFPQLKLENAVPPVRLEASSESLPCLDFLLRLEPQPAEKIRFSRLNKTTSMLQVIRHTVASKLFDRGLMHSHCAFARQLSTDIPVLELSYPRAITELPALRQAVIDAFSRVE